jgi:hypothetical protein
MASGAPAVLAARSWSGEFGGASGGGSEGAVPVPNMRLKKPLRLGSLVLTRRPFQ